MIDPQFVYQDDHMMTYSDEYLPWKNYKVIQVQMYNIKKWTEMGSAVEIGKIGKKNTFRSSKSFPFKHRVDRLVLIIKLVSKARRVSAL